ncbi:hypothetical protein ACFODZ_05020 [Marinicella sediminis]|uniref:Uncharacterized protein n=1 Tax=Marinicella sediminis TaxID=1792834 RepID=A0ABV7J9N1_9GAMM|nr:hypothetical protein [Marinicella sediminis]
MNSTNNNYNNESHSSPIKNVIPFKSNLSAIDETHLIKEGVYEATLNTWETTISFGLPRLILYFTITECGEHFGKTFRKFYYVKKLNGKPKIKGKFIAKCSGSFLKHWYKVFPKIKRLRTDRVPMQNLNGIVIKVKVRTVKKDFEGDKLPEQMQYSVVDELLEN